MSHRLLLFATFILASAIEVQVRASDQTAFVQEPQQCLRSTGDCSIKAKVDKQKFDLGKGELVLGRGAIVYRDQAEVAHLVRGFVTMNTDGELSIQSEFAKIGCASECVVLIEKNTTHVRVTTVSGEARVYPKGESVALNLPEGYSMRVGQVLPNGKADAEIPQAAQYEPTFKKWWASYAGEKEAFLKSALEFREACRVAVEAGSTLHLDLAHRYIASVEDERREAEEARRRQAAEQEKMRRLFRQMNHLEEP